MGHLDLVKTLLEAGAEVDVDDDVREIVAVVYLLLTSEYTHLHLRLSYLCGLLAYVDILM